MDLYRRKIENSSLLSPNLKALRVNELWAFEVRTTWRMKIFKWWIGGNIPTTITEYALSANFGKWIAKGVIYLKHKKSLKLGQFQKTYSKRL